MYLFTCSERSKSLYDAQEKPSDFAEKPNNSASRTLIERQSHSSSGSAKGRTSAVRKRYDGSRHCSISPRLARSFRGLATNSPLSRRFTRADIQSDTARMFLATFRATVQIARRVTVLDYQQNLAEKVPTRAYQRE